MNWNKDYILKIVSLLLSVFMWFYVIDVQNPETEITITDIPIKYINTESVSKFGLVLVDNASKKLTLKVSGRRKAVSTLNNENIIAYADFKGINNVGEFPIMVQVKIPREDVKVIDKEPYNIDVELDRIKEIQKSITVVTQGDIDEPYIGLEPKVTPNMVTIEGPSNIINNVNSVRVLLDVNNHTNDIITSSKVILYDKDNRIITNDNIKVNVESVEIEYPIKMKKSIPVEAALIGTPPGSYVVEDVQISPISVTVIGDKEDIDKFYTISTYPIDISDFKDEQQISSKLHLPEGIELLNPDKNVTVDISIGKELVKTMKVDDIKTYNIPEGLSYNLLTKSINITIKGMEDSIEDIESDDINAYINLSGYDEGEHIVPIEVNIDEKVKVLGSYSALVRLNNQNTNTDNSQTTTQPNENTEENIEDSEENTENTNNIETNE